MNRKWYTGVALLLLVLLPAKAQKRWSIIPTVGIQMSQVKQGEVGKPLTAIKGGVMGSYSLRSGDLGRIYLESGVLFSKKGFAGSEGVPISSYNTTAVEVPLLLKLDINLTQQVNSFFRFGPCYGRALTAKEGIDPNDYGIQMGIGAEYRHWIVALDGGFGTHNINIGAQGKAKHISGCLSVGYRF